jgi:transposase
VKVLAWERGGFVLWYKRLERGRFRVPESARSQDHVVIDAGQLAFLLEGVDYSRVRRPMRWEPPLREAG